MKSTLAIFVALVVSVIGSAEDKPKRPSVGDQAPAIDLQMVLQAPPGAKATWETLRGKVVVLEFWATWCGPCVGAISHMNELTDEFKNKPVQFISITDEDEKTIKEFLQKKSIHGWVGLNTSDSMSKSYHVEGIPHTVVVGADGKIAGITHPTHLEKKHLENVLAGKESGLPVLEDDDADTVSAKKTAEELPAYFQFVLRPSKGEFAGWWSGGAGTSELGPMYESKAQGIDITSMLPNAYGAHGKRLIVEAPLPKGNFDLIIRTTQDARKDWSSFQRAAIEATFGLTSRRETRELDVYVLTSKSSGAKGLRPTVAPKAGFSSSGPGRADAINQKVGPWAVNLLEGQMQRPVIDETSLSGGYDIEFRWDADKSLAPEQWVELVRDQLGMELTAAKRPMDVVIVTKKQ